jgi:hypothetical protein
LLPKCRQIVENGVDQVDLGGVGENPETKKKRKKRKKRKKWAGRFFSNKENGAKNGDFFLFFSFFSFPEVNSALINLVYAVFDNLSAFWQQFLCVLCNFYAIFTIFSGFLQLF